MSKLPQQNKKKNKTALGWKIPVAVCALFMFALAASFWWDSAQAQKEIRALTIEDQDMSSLHDGTYEGAYAYNGFTYKVQVTSLNYKLTDIKIVANRTTKHSKMAEGVIQNVLNKGNVNVDVIAGATTTSKALLKAIEHAISCNL